MAATNSARRLPYGLVLPAAALLVLSLGYPLVRQVVLSFHEYGLAQQFGRPAAWVGLDNYRALVTDVSLKGTLNGWEVTRQIREKDPAFPIIYMTGAGTEEWASQGVPNSMLLMKPFAPAQLVTAVSQLLNGAPQPERHPPN